MYQSTTPSLSQAIWPRWASTQFLSLPIVQTLLPVTFGYSVNSEVVVMRQLRRWKRLWRRSLTRSHKRLPWGLPEVVGMVQQMHCSRRLLQRRLEFHVYTINKSAHTKEVWKLIVCTSYLPCIITIFRSLTCSPSESKNIYCYKFHFIYLSIAKNLWGVSWKYQD